MFQKVLLNLYNAEKSEKYIFRMNRRFITFYQDTLINEKKWSLTAPQKMKQSPFIDYGGNMLSGLFIILP